MLRRICGSSHVRVVTGALVIVLAGASEFAWAQGGGTPDPPAQGVRFDAIASLELMPLEGCRDSFPSIVADLAGATGLDVLLDRGKRTGKAAAIRSMNLAGGGGDPDPADNFRDSFFDVFLMLDESRDSKWHPPSASRDSFFDVFFILDLTDASGNMVMARSDVPVHLMGGPSLPPSPPMPFAPSMLLAPPMPPLETRFESNQAVPFFLIGEGTYPPNPCVELRWMSFVPVSPSAAVIKRELIQIEKKLDRLLGAGGGPTVPPTTD